MYHRTKKTHSFVIFGVSPVLSTVSENIGLEPPLWDSVNDVRSIIDPGRLSVEEKSNPTIGQLFILFVHSVYSPGFMSVEIEL